MAKTRGAKASSPSSRPKAPRVAAVQGSMTEPPQPLAVPPSTYSKGPTHSLRASTSEDYRVGLILPRVTWFIYCPEGHPHTPYGAEERNFARALFRISEGFFFGPRHLIMVALLYFEEKVHRKKLLRADAIPLLFPRLLCQILEHLGYPFEPQLERRRICREIFTLDKWTSMTTYDAEPGAPAGTRASRGATAG
ncbi:hypothetical protein CK203_033731 [Vitis vinifera]|uniref:Uncharacterized protein n=1 Tax=Vitis vinifera TaxID=29760 RepID=A0A438IQG9_VITVI|nr:hypothetical protein CK203_033731 [Vitis vinifera]